MYIQIHVYTNIYTHVYIHISVNVYIYMCICIYTCFQMQRFGKLLFRSVSMVLPVWKLPLIASLQVLKLWKIFSLNINIKFSTHSYVTCSATILYLAPYLLKNNFCDIITIEYLQSMRILLELLLIEPKTVLYK